MLNNAIKFTHSGYVELRCFLTEETESHVKVRFDVIDTGIGIHPDKLQLIFEQFKQGDSDITQKYGGTGLGLTICKNLIELQDGSLTVSSQENIGTTFSFVIPYLKGNEDDIISTDFGNINPGKLKNKNVLLVDDDSVNRLLGKTILEKIGCAFDIANNGKEAIARLDKNEYDIVLLDIHLPDINGIHIAKYIRQKKNKKSPKILAVTAAAMMDDIEKYYQSGINDFLVKPYKEIHLFNKMCEVLKLETISYPKPFTEIILKEEIHPKNYDLTALRTMSGHDPKTIKKMIATFIESSENALQYFETALSEKDWKSIGETAHKILPSYRHLEVNSIVSKLFDLKNKTLNPDNIDEDEIKYFTKMVIRSIKKLLAELRNEF